MIIAVASGKGGTGKTTVSANLARSMGSGVQVIDCDVEEPNAHLFLRGRKMESEIVSIPVPEVDSSLCDACGECGRFCRFHAIVSFGSSPLVFPDLCHACGGCTLVCPRGAISEKGNRIGVVETSECVGVTLVQGRLDIGVAMAPP
ncbi:MAG TPA: 4Fe-4S binding protein, partial [Geobacteraceae bacterium]|nr:4Fe-4S binding protein [Geobacteraceae bacterium]